MKLYGLIGYPLGHSFSPDYFHQKFTQEGIDADYRLFPLSHIDALNELLHSQNNLAGFNVTIPYKELILKYLDIIDKDAEAIGAVNCVKIIRSEIEAVSGKNGNFLLAGANTDARAFAETLAEGWTLPPKALIFGTGGAAKAVAFALQKLQIDFHFVSRTTHDHQTYLYSELSDKILIENKLWINASPVGMYPNTAAKLQINTLCLSPEHHVYDLIYNPEETLLLKEARLGGAQVKNGLAMLHRQADLAWKYFSLPLSPHFGGMASR